MNQPTLRAAERRATLLGRRGLKRNAPKIPFPNYIEKQYKSEILNLVNKLENEINNVLITQLENIGRSRDLDLRMDSWVEDLDNLFSSLFIFGSALADAFKPLINLKAAQIGDWNTKAYKQSIKTTLGVDPISDDKGLQSLINSWALDNSRLIKTIPEQLLNDVAGITQRGFSSGASVRDITKEIKERYKIPRYRAETIARTETGKLNGNLTKSRDEGMGIKTYYWSATNDERLRPSHKALDGLLCRWDDNTVYSDDEGKTWKKRSSIGGEKAHPGHAINCRCSSRSNIEEALRELGV